MASEKALWGTLKRNSPAGSYQRHEDKVSVGIPDVSFAFRHLLGVYSGWIELKEADYKPRKAVDVGLEDWQRAWLIDRGSHGALCFVLVQIGREYFWYTWKHLLVIDINILMLSEHKAKAHYWSNGLSQEDIVNAIASADNSA